MADAAAPSILFDVDAGVAHLRLNAPERRNAISRPMLDAIDGVVRTLSGATDVGVVTLTGRGPHFCAGWDTSSFTALGALSEDAIVAELRSSRAVVERLRALPQVIVAAVHGVTAGFGLALVASADIVLADENAEFAAPEIAHGIVPGQLIHDLGAILPPHQAASWLLLGRRHTAAEAHVGGLVSEVVARGRLDEAVADLIARLSGLDGTALRRTNDVVREASRRRPSEAELERAFRAAAASVRARAGAVV